VTRENTEMDAADKDLAAAEKDIEAAFAKTAAPAAATVTETVTTEGEKTTVTETPPEVKAEERETTQVVDDDQTRKAALEADIAALEKRKRDLNGEIGGELSKRSQAKVAELTGMVAQLQAEISALKTAPAKTQPQAGLSDLTVEKLLEGVPAELRETWEPLLKANAEMIGRATKQSQEVTAAQMAEIRQRQEAERVRQEASARDTFTDEVERIAPGFANVNGKGGSSADPEWVEHLDTQKPGTRVTWRQSITSVAADPSKEAAEAFAEYQKSKGITPPPKKVVAPTAGQVQPRRNSASVEVTPPKPTDLKAEANKLLADFENGKISDEEFEKQSKAIHQKMGMAPGN